MPLSWKKSEVDNVVWWCSECLVYTKALLLAFSLQENIFVASFLYQWVAIFWPFWSKNLTYQFFYLLYRYGVSSFHFTGDFFTKNLNLSGMKFIWTTQCIWFDLILLASSKLFGKCRWLYTPDLMSWYRIQPTMKKPRTI